MFTSCFMWFKRFIYSLIIKQIDKRRMFYCFQISNCNELHTNNFENYRLTQEKCHRKANSCFGARVGGRSQTLLECGRQQAAFDIAKCAM